MFSRGWLSKCRGWKEEGRREERERDKERSDNDKYWEQRVRKSLSETYEGQEQERSKQRKSLFQRPYSDLGTTEEPTVVQGQEWTMVQRLERK